MPPDPGTLRSGRSLGPLVRTHPDPPFTTGQVDLLKTDNVASGNLPGLRELGIEPRTVEQTVPDYLDRLHGLITQARIDGPCGRLATVMVIGDRQTAKDADTGG